MNPTDDTQSKLNKHFLLIASISAGLVLAACQQEGPAEKAGQKIDKAVVDVEQKIERAADKTGEKLDEAKQSVKDKAEVAEEFVDDVVISLKIKTAIAKNYHLKNSKIEVNVANGVVTLSGTVDSEPNIRRAIQTAENEEDVKSVIDKLVFKAKTKGE